MAHSANGDSRRPVKSFKDMLQGNITPESANIKYEQGVFSGMPALFISDADMITLAKPYELTLVGKFATPRPPLASIRKFVSRMNFIGNVMVDVHDNLNVIFRFSEEDDYNRFFHHRYYTVFGVTMKVVKWSPFVDISEELPIVPLWLSFPGLRLQLFDKTSLLFLGKMFGKPLSVDASTAACGNISKARILVEIDVTKPIPNRIWLGSLESGFFQSVIVENKPLYCEKCKVFGHEVTCCTVDVQNNPVDVHLQGAREGSVSESNPPDAAPLLITMGHEEVLDNSENFVINLDPSDLVFGETRVSSPINAKGYGLGEIAVCHSSPVIVDKVGVGFDGGVHPGGIIATSAKHALVDVHSKKMQGKSSDPEMFENENLGENLGDRNNVEVEDTCCCKTGWESGDEIPPLSPQDAIAGDTSVVDSTLLHGYPSSGITTRAMAKMGGAKKEQAWGKFWQQTKNHKGKKKATDAMAMVRDAIINPPDFYA